MKTNYECTFGSRFTAWSRLKAASTVAVVIAASSVQWASAESPAQATPFGLKQGMTKAQLQVKKPLTTAGMFELTTVPNPHPDFESYVVQIGPTTGLCFVKAIGTDVSTSIYGTDLLLQYKRLRDQIGTTYGKHEEFDVLKPGSIWDEPRDWMMALKKKERTLMANWKKGNVKVYLAANALSTDKGYLALEYYFDNEPMCQQELDKASATVF